MTSKVIFVDQHGHTLTVNEALDKMRCNITQAKYYRDHDIEKPRKLKKSERSKYNFGDILYFYNGSDRDCGSYVIGRNGEMIPNSDHSDSGYMTIPIKITKRLYNTMKYYHDYINNKTTCADFELRHDDGWIIDTFGREFPKEWKKIVVTYNDGGFFMLEIESENGEVEFFDEMLTFDEIECALKENC
uniref:Uncharacterized protein n=1 Tax=Marseillevirus LCMAC102 TaxID=2506603 RepID=A0A481YUH7_9VIRU|nr:MAG: hypothetical protein LCMAC102_02200 [Marseillevirus LCMAC102]